MKTTNAHHLACEICQLLNGPAEDDDKEYQRQVSEVAALLEELRIGPPPVLNNGDRALLDLRNAWQLSHDDK